MAFAKLFETEDMGQILVMAGQSPECVPEVRAWVQPAGLAPCSIAIGFDDSEAGEVQSHQAFERFDLESARKAAKAIFDMLAHGSDVEDDVKVDVMREILRAKVQQHEYVLRKLLATGDRELIEDSWRDAFWGWGPNRDGRNMLGRLWMEVRAEIRAQGAS